LLLQRVSQVIEAPLEAGFDIGPRVGGGGFQFGEFWFQIIDFLLGLRDFLIEGGFGVARLCLGLGFEVVQLLA
jgi:hypothetical protein